MTDTLWAHLHDALLHLGTRSMAEKSALTAAAVYFYLCLYPFFGLHTSRNHKLLSKLWVNNWDSNSIIKPLFYSAWCPSPSRKNLLFYEWWHYTDASNDKAQYSKIPSVSPVSACCYTLKCWTFVTGTLGFFQNGETTSTVKYTVLNEENTFMWEVDNSGLSCRTKRQFKRQKWAMQED